jgi:hypothetical protein
LDEWKPNQSLSGVEGLAKDDTTNGETNGLIGHRPLDVQALKVLVSAKVLRDSANAGL